MSMKFLTYTGNVFDLDNITDNDIDIRDIAHSLAFQCRYIGHCIKYYSVAEHSIRMVEAGLPGRPKVLLLHDAAEAYIGDIVSPIKRSIYYNKTSIRELEDRILKHIGYKFNVLIKHSEFVAADRIMLATEVRDLVNPLHPEIYEEYIKGYEPLKNYQISYTLNPEQAEKRFLEKCYDLHIL